MTRMDAMRRQYDHSDCCGNQPTGRISPVRPRNRFWRWFWLILILAVLGGFLKFKEPLLKLYDEMIGRSSEPVPAAVPPIAPEA